jgi:hypothetical protein
MTAPTGNGLKLRVELAKSIAAIMTDRDEAPKPTEWSRQFEALGLNAE